MANVSAQATSSGIGFFGLLAIVFITLKLTGFIDWSWFWVLSPLVLPLIVFAFLFALAFIIFLYKEFKNPFPRKTRRRL